jgi:lipoate---protein ligase
MNVYISKQMIYIDNPYTDTGFNLAAEEYLLKNFSSNVFMLWQNEPSVIIGKHQNLQAEVNMDYARENQIKTFRRFSGGGTVYQDLGNVNLSFIETSVHPEFNKFTLQMLAFLSSIGIHAEANERRALFINGFKISGCAQYLRKNKVLYHATLLFSTNLNHLVSTLDSIQTDSKNEQVGKSWNFVKSVKSPVANISTYLTEPLTLSKFKKSIFDFFFKMETDNQLYFFSEEDLAAITKLKQEKYATKNWNEQT